MKIAFLGVRVPGHLNPMTTLARRLKARGHDVVFISVLDTEPIAQGKAQQALAEIEKEPSQWAQLTGQALTYHALGREQDSNAALAALIAKYDTLSAYQIAQVHAYRGESDKSFEWLERAYKQRDTGLPSLNTDPLFKNLRHDPRYTELLKKMRLPT